MEFKIKCEEEEEEFIIIVTTTMKFAEQEQCSAQSTDLLDLDLIWENVSFSVPYKKNKVVRSQAERLLA